MRVGGVVGVAAGELGEPVQLAVMPVEQFLERVLLACDVRGEQLRIGAMRFAFSELSEIPRSPHSRTLNGAEGAFDTSLRGWG